MGKLVGWAAAQKEGGRRGNWVKQGEKKEKGKKFPFSFPDIYIFLKLIFLLKFEFKTLYKFHTSQK